MRRWGKFGSLLAAAALLAACGDDEEQAATAPSEASTTATTTTTTATTTTTDGIDTLPGAGTKPVVVKAANSEVALLTDVRAARHEGYDRVVFEFSNALPGYDVRYIERPLNEDGSGRVVKVDGTYLVRVRMDNALDADLTKESAPRTYTGPARFAPPTPEVAELVRAGGFEGVLTWAAGLRDRVDFRVTTLDAPPRLVVDFRNH